MQLPNFMIIGAQKAGTTWLAHCLSQHPDVFIAEQEIHFFDKSYNFSKGIDWYAEHFASVSVQSAVGEKTPDYLWANGIGVEGHLPDVHRNIYAALPHARLIVIVRNPVERALSAVNHIVRSGRIPPNVNIDELLFGNQQHLIAGHGVIEYGYYYRQIMAFREYFSPEQMLILVFEEDIVKTPEQTLRRTCEFLNIEPDFSFAELDKRANEYKSSQPGLWLAYRFPAIRSLILMLDQRLPLPTARLRASLTTVERLRAIYADENARLFEMLGLNKSIW